ncbi:hypothetical protein O0L34_g8010 [Tuta absoluta]|nr:hypothetical protein O0L34_g8010 [Tuta absoluta]
MRRREVSKFVKVLIGCLVYSLVYINISFLMAPTPIYNFVSEDMRIGEKYVLIYLIAKGPIFSDVDGADVFRNRGCGDCFITNNNGFLPTSEYDAVVVHGDRNTYVDPSKLYMMRTPKRCLERKLQGCEPRVTSVATGEHFDLYHLCRQLHEIRYNASRLKLKNS